MAKLIERMYPVGPVEISTPCGRGGGHCTSTRVFVDINQVHPEQGPKVYCCQCQGLRSGLSVNSITAFGKLASNGRDPKNIMGGNEDGN